MGLSRWIGLSLSLCAGLLLSAKAAQAQVDIDPKADMCVEEDDGNAVYEATVTTDDDFFLDLTVKHNGNIKHVSRDYVSNSGPSVNYSKTIDVSDWGLEEDDTLDYIGTATIAAGPNRGNFDSETESDTVQASGTCLNPDLIEDSEVLPKRSPVRIVAIREETI